MDSKDVLAVDDAVSDLRTALGLDGLSTARDTSARIRDAIAARLSCDEAREFLAAIERVEDVLTKVLDRGI